MGRYRHHATGGELAQLAAAAGLLLPVFPVCFVCFLIASVLTTAVVFKLKRKHPLCPDNWHSSH